MLTSALTLGEVLVKPMEAGDEALMRRYEHAIEAGATVLPFDQRAARRFADHSPGPFDPGALMRSSLPARRRRTWISSSPTTID